MSVSRLAVAAVAVGSVLGMASQATAALALTELWRIDAGQGGSGGSGKAWFQADNNTRGMAYNPATNHVLVVSRTGGNNIRILDGSNGNELGTLNLGSGVITGGTFAVNQIGVGADGAIYVANLTTNSSTSPLKVYRWDNEAATPVVVYSGDPGGATRYGDDMDVRRSGANTEIILGANGTPRVAVLDGYNGTSFNGNGILYPSGTPNGFARLGITFDQGNMFFAAQSGLRRADYDVNTDTGTILNAYSTTAYAASGNPIGADPGAGLLVAVHTAGNLTSPPPTGFTQIVRLYDVSNRSVDPVLLDEETLLSNYANGNGAGAVDWDMGNYRVFVLDTNNSIVAYSVPEPGAIGLCAMGALAGLRRRRD